MDKELEDRIEKAGRYAVFAAAAANGWTTYNAPPKWVWFQLCAEIERRNANTPPHEAKLAGMGG